MQFVVIAYDGRDDQALDRRMKVRDEHIAAVEELVNTGRGLMGAALLDDDGKMFGSVQVLDFPSREALDKYLASEPYVVGGVWKDVKVIPCQVAAPYTSGS